MPKRILIIDDDPLFTKLLSHRIGVANHEAVIDTLDPNTQGWPTHSSAFTEYDVIFLDYLLGNFDGMRCIASIRQLTRRAYITIISGTTNEKDAVLSIKAGADNYLPKQLLTPERIKDVIASAEDDNRDNATNTNFRLSNTHGMHARKGNLLFPRIDGYKIKRKIGVGGMAAVYLAERKFDQLDVVIKVLDTTESQAQQLVERTRLEYELISEIDNENVIVIDEIGEHDGLIFIVMEHFDAGDLKQRIEHRFSTIQAIKFLKDIAAGLLAIDQKQYVHRDLKPSNIMFRSDGTLAIIDFSVAKSLAFESGITLEGEVVGTPYYMSPEQAIGNRVDIRSDIYSLGIILYEMLLGRKPFYARDLQELIRMQINQPLPELPVHLNSFNWLLEKMTAKAPDQRFQNVQELSDALRKY